MSAVPFLCRKRCGGGEMMVVSETGARWPPKIEPEMMAPASMAGLAPRARPAAKKIGKAVNMVPIEDPVDIEIAQTAMNVNTVNAAPPAPRASASQTKPSE